MKGLVLWLKFNEGSGSKVYDSSFYNNHGTINGAVWVNGKFGKALEFDGVDDYVEVPHSESLNITDEITFLAWINPAEESVNNNKNIIEKNVAGPIFWTRNLAGYPYFGCVIDETFRSVAATTKLIPNQWQLIGGYYDGTELAIIINGKISNTVSITGSLSTSDNPITIGVDNTLTSGYFFNGTIDEVRIYNRALSAEEIQILYYNRIGAVEAKAI
ncbi:MAG: LamG domain-containing protein [Candidatus Verstraetearchaeota archaeon]|nr:LamG domain-containing protein [Candidatus Verstraetearchaeota archaeon]